MNGSKLPVTLLIGAVEYRGFVERVPERKQRQAATKEMREQWAAQRRERMKMMLAKHPELWHRKTIKTEL